MTITKTLSDEQKYLNICHNIKMLRQENHPYRIKVGERTALNLLASLRLEKTRYEQANTTSV